MKDMVIDLINCCENRIATVEELINGAYCTTAPLDVSLGEVAQESTKLSADLQDILARKCSLRKKDFNVLMEQKMSELQFKRKYIEAERMQVKTRLEEYLNEQKQLVFLNRTLDG